MARTKIDSTLISPFVNTFIGMGRNRVVNGDMVISQDAGGALKTVNTNGDFWPVDMLRCNGQVADGVFTAQRTTTTPPTGFLNYVRFTVTTADASIGTNQLYVCTSAIEGFNMRDLLFGTANAKTITLSFWVRSSLTGSFSGALSNSAVDRSYPFSYTISAANTWEQKIITITGDLTGTWLTDSGIGVRIYFDLGAGTGKRATANVWAAGSNVVGVTGAVSLIATNGATLDLTGIQFEVGSTSSPFEFWPLPSLLAVCQRYYEKTYDLDQAPGTNTGSGTVYVPMPGATTAIAQYGTVQYKVTKRATPTITGYTAAGTSATWQVRDNGGTIDNNGSTSIDQVGITNFRIRITAITSSPLTASSSSNWYIAYGHWVADARI